MTKPPGTISQAQAARELGWSNQRMYYHVKKGHFGILLIISGYKKFIDKEGLKSWQKPERAYRRKYE